MKLPLVIGTLLFAARGLTFTLIDAVDYLYFYTVYDLDVTVFGVGNGYMAPKCKGSGEGGRCNYNEFVNYIQDGTPSATPAYAEVSGDWQFTPGSSANIILASYEILSKSNKEPNSDVYTRLRDGRKTSVGIWNDLGFAVEKGRVTGATKDINIGRHMANVKGVLSAVTEFRRADANTKLLDHLKGRVKDAVWETVDRESKFQQSKWQEIEWEKTVKFNPDMKDPKSELFKEVTYQMNEHFKNAKVITAKTINAKLARTANLCLG